MKLSSMYKNLQAAGVVAVLALGFSSHASAIAVFTVDPNAAFGALGGPHPGPFDANFIIGNSSSLVALNTGHQTQAGQGWVNFSTFVDNQTNVLGNVSGLNNNWQMWAEFSYTLQLTSGTYAAVNSTYTVTGLNATLWVDPTIASATTFNPATNAGGAASVNHGTDSFIIATAGLLVGDAAINGQGGTGFNTTNSFSLNAAGSQLFTAPVPFYNLQFQEFNNTAQGVFVLADSHITINQASGGVDFNRIPEPATLALLGIGLLGIGASTKRRRKG
ncbi:MAG: flocculation-associated PEP-CTERM protein PepA [Nitrosospira sp.]|nr:flocculation-associated PEP-CTERM protein PepA [Nitrosospira sp.]